MKFRTTIILLAVFVALLAFILVFETKTKGKKESEEKLVDLPSADVKKITLKKEDGFLAFEKDDKGDWFIKEPLEAKADTSEVNRLAEDFSGLRLERVVEPEAADPSKYEIPKEELTLWYKERPQPVKILIGMENPLDRTLFAKREDDKRIVLIPSHLKSLLDKKILDFRQKDIFKFEVEEAGSLKLKANEISWEALKKEGEWFFRTPAALAKKSRIEDILRALSNLKAKEFLAEQKQASDLDKFGLRKPEFLVTLTLPAKTQEVTFFLHKQDDKVYATTSLSSKIVETEGQVLTDIAKKIDDLREKQVLVFNSWEAQKVSLKKGDLALVAAKGKGKDREDTWFFEPEAKEEADRSKIETFVRKIESLEAAEFIEAPANLEEFGLAQPQAEVTVWTRDGEKENEYKVLIGKEDPEKKRVAVKNPRLDYLFLVDSAFLGELPKEAKDWKVAAPEEKKEEKKEERK